MAQKPYNVNRFNIGYNKKFKSYGLNTSAQDSFANFVNSSFVNNINGATFEAIGGGSNAMQIRKDLSVLNAFKKDLKEHNSIFALDLETIGSFSETATESVKKVMAITEASLVKKTPLGLNTGGDMEYAFEKVSSFALGVTPEQGEELRTMLGRWNPSSFKGVNEEETRSINSIMERLARTGASVLYGEGANGSIPIINGVPTIASFTMAYDKTDTNLINMGIQALEDLGKKGYAINKNNRHTYGNKLFEGFVNTLNGLDARVVGHNTNGFDIPFIDAMSKEANVKFNGIKNSLDIHEMFNNIGINPLEFYEDNDASIVKGFGRQENIIGHALKNDVSKAKGAIKGMAHTADYDTFAVIHMLTNQLKNGKGTILDILDKTGTEKLQNLINVSPGSNDVFRTANTLFLKSVVNDNKDLVLDHALVKDANGNYVVDKKRKASFKANNYYKFDSIKEIALDDLKSSLTENQYNAFSKEGISNLYVGSFSQQGTKDGDIINIVRANKEDFNDVFAYNLERVKLKDNELRKEFLRNEEDSARNILSSVKGSDGFAHNRGMSAYKAFNNAEKEFTRRGEKLTKANMDKIVNDKMFTFSNGEILSAEELLPQLLNKEGVLDTKLLSTEKHAYQYIKSTAPVYGQFSDLIEQVAGKAPGSFEAQVFKNAEMLLDKELEKSGFKVTRESAVKSTLQKASTVTVMIDGEARNIDTSSVKKIENSIKNIIYTDAHNVRNENTKMGINKDKIKEIVSQLKDKGVITSSTEEAIEKSFQGRFNVSLIAKDIKETMNKKTNLLVDSQKQDPVFAKEKIEKELKMLKDERKDLYKLKNELNKYGAKGSYTGENALENIENDRKKATKEIERLEKAKRDIEKNITNLDVSGKDFKKILAEIDDLKKQRKDKQAELKKFGKVFNNNKNIANNLDALNRQAQLRDEIDTISSRIDARYKYKHEIMNNNQIKKINKQIKRNNGIVARNTHFLQEVPGLKNNLSEANKHIFSLLDKRNQLDWLINTGNPNMEMINVTKTVKAGNLRFDKAVKKLGISLEDIVNKALGITPRELKSLNTKATAYETIDELGGFLKSELGWSDKEADRLMNTLSSKKGIENLVDGNGKNDLAYSIVTRVDEANKLEKNYLVFTRKGNLGSVNALAGTEKDFGSNMVSFELAKKINKNGVEYAQRGASIKLNTSKITGYINNHGDKPKIMLEEENVIEQMLDVLKSKQFKENVYTAMDNREGVKFSKSINRRSFKAMSDAPGHTGVTIVKNKVTNAFEEILTPNMGDLATSKMKNLEVMVNFAPYLYDSDKEFKSMMDSAVEKAKSGQTAMEYFADWKGDIQKGKLRKLDDISISAVKELFITNFKGGKGFYKSIKENKDVMNMFDENNFNLSAFLKDVELNGSQNVSEVKAPGFNMTFQGLNTIMGGGEAVNNQRPLTNQAARYQHLNLDKFTDKELKDFKEHGISLGKSINSLGAKELLKEDGVNSLIEGITVDVKSIGNAELMKNYKNFKLTEDVVKNIEDMVQKSGMTMDHSEILETAERLLKSNYFKHEATNTYMQRTVLSPMLSKMLETDTYHNLKKDHLETVSKSIGDTVKLGDVIGVDANGKEIKYTNQREGIIVGDKGGSFLIKETDAAINSVKVNVGITEKGIAHVEHFANEKERMVAQGLWEAQHGKVGALVHYELKKHYATMFEFSGVQTIADMVLKSDNDKYKNEFMETLKGLTDNGEVELITRFEGTKKHQEFLYKNSQDVNKDVFKAYQDIIDTYYKKAKEDGADKFYKDIVSAIEDKKSKHIDTVALSQMQHNRQYGNQSDIDATIDELADKYGAKDNVRDSYHFGRKIIDAPDAEKYFYDIDEHGNRSYIGKNISEYLDNRHVGNKEYNIAKENLQNIDLSLKLRSGAIKESEVKGKIKEVDLQHLILPASGVDAEQLKNTIFADSDASVIKVNLEDSHIILKDAMNFEEDVNRRRTYKDVSSIYIPVQKNNFVMQPDGTEMFVPTETQKNVADLLDSLQMASQPNAENATGYKKIAQEKYSGMILSAEHEYRNKEGMMHKHILSGRVDFSGTDLVTKVLDSDRYLLGKENLDKDHAFNHTIKEVINGKETNAYLDVVYLSEDAITKKGGKDIFSDIGEQLAKENDFDGNQRFIEHLKNKGLLNDDNKIAMHSKDMYDEIGREFVKTEGLQGFSKRYPVFSADSKIPTLIRLDEGAKGNTVSFFGYTLMKLKGDVDGDSIADSLLLNRGDDGKVRMLNKGTKVRDTFERMIRGEAILNNEQWIAKDKAEYEGIDKQQLHNQEEGFSLAEHAKEKGNAKNGNFLNDDAIYAEVKAKYDKVAIGPISNTNLYLNQISDYAEKQGIIDSEQLNDIMKMTKITEQKPISSKFFINAADAAGATSRQSSAYRRIAKGNLDEGFDMLMTSLMDMGLLTNGEAVISQDVNSKHYLDMNWLKDKDYLKKIESIGSDKLDDESKTILKGAGALIQALSDPNVQMKWKESGFMDKSTTRNVEDEHSVNSSANVVNDIINDELDSDLFPTETIKSHRDKLYQNTSSQSHTAQKVSNNNIYYDADGSAFSVLNRMQTGDNELKFTMKNLHSGEITTLTGKGKEYITDTNKAIHEHLTEGRNLVSIDTSGMSDNEREFFQSKEFANDYKPVVGKYQQSINSDIENKAHYKSELDAMNERIIQLGREAKENKAQSLQDEVHNTYGRLERMNSEFTHRETLTPNELENEYKGFGANTKSSFSGRENVNSNGGTVNSKNYSHLDNLKGYNVGAYAEEFNNNINDILSNNEDLNLSDYRKQVVAEQYKNSEQVAVNATKHNIEISDKHLEEYVKDASGYKSYAKWNTNWDDALKNTDLSNDTGIRNTLNNLDEIGKGKISAGDYTGSNFSSLSLDQRNSVIEELENIKTHHETDSKKYAMLNDNIDALKNYNRYVGYVSDLNEGSEEIAKSLKNINSESLPNNYSTEMKSSLDKDFITKQMRATNDAIIKTAEEEGKYAQKTLSNEAKDIVDNSFHMSASKALAIGAGVMATTALLGAASGVAGKLNPGTTPTAVHNDNQEFQQKKLSPVSPVAPRNIYMQDAQKGFSIHAKSKYGQVNDLQISRALSVAHSDRVGKVNVHVQNSYNDDNWFNTAMANELS